MANKTIRQYAVSRDRAITDRVVAVLQAEGFVARFYSMGNNGVFWIESNANGNHVRAVVRKIESSPAPATPEAEEAEKLGLGADAIAHWNKPVHAPADGRGGRDVPLCGASVVDARVSSEASDATCPECRAVLA